ncbi:C-GCAxxG-C-C family protein [Patescibacteria group bacterium]|nr:C-GCAxxG-C-C family protein [Patescibacteria group bacterium]
MSSMELTANAPTRDLAQVALHHGAKGRSCSEAIMLAYAPALGLDPAMAVKLASGFGGGMGISGEVCGALTAACMVVGLRFGTDQVGDSYTRQRTYLLVQELLERFRSEVGAVQCRELCFARLSAGQGFADVRQLDLPGKLISLAADTLEELLYGDIE